MIVVKVLLLLILYAFLITFFTLMLSPIKGYAYSKNGFVLLRATYIWGALRLHYELDRDKNRLVINVFGFKVRPHQTESEKSKNKRSKKDKKSKKRKQYGMPTKNVIGLSLHLVKKLLCKIAPKHANLKLSIGLDDPYSTALIKMASDLVFLHLNKIKNYNFYLKADHINHSFAYEADLTLNFTLIGLIMPFLLFIFKKPIRDYLGLFKRNRHKTPSLNNF